MQDLRVGRLIRAVRVRKGWRQDDLAARAGVSQATISRIERGHVEEMALGTIRAVSTALEISLDLQPRGRGADLDRLVNARHSALHEAVTRHLATTYPDWVLAPEVSFNIYGERGIIDIMLWHPARRALLIIELKTELVDPGELLATMDIRRRLAARIVADRGWRPTTVSTWVIVARSRTNERRLSTYRSMLRSAFPIGRARDQVLVARPSGVGRGVVVVGRPGRLGARPAGPGATRVRLGAGRAATSSSTHDRSRGRCQAAA